MIVTRLYSVYLDPREARPYESPIFVPDGFNFYAFFFHFFWAVYHRIWIPAFIFLALLIAVEFLTIYADLSIYSHWIMLVGIRTMIGMAANDLWRDTLEKRGYIVSDVVIADSMLGAERRFFDRHLGHAGTDWKPGTPSPIHV